MRIRLLGTAAGGGVPQWNCNCHICSVARSGGRVRPRTQSSAAISAEGQRWFLLNASPDIRAQLESFPPLHPPRNSTRGSPIEGVLLTNADLDHSLGILLLREGEKLAVHATPATQEALSLFMKPVESFCGIQWLHPPSDLGRLYFLDGSNSGLQYRKILLGGKPPRFAAQDSFTPDNVIGYEFYDESTRGRLLYLPNVPTLSHALTETARDADVILFDGTFWSETEMSQVLSASHLTASGMGHVPISGTTGSLAFLQRMPARHKIYVHMNNTNPVLLEGSTEEKMVLAAGCLPAIDGMEFAI